MLLFKFTKKIKFTVIKLLFMDIAIVTPTMTA